MSDTEARLQQIETIVSLLFQSIPMHHYELSTVICWHCNAKALDKRAIVHNEDCPIGKLERLLSEDSD